MTAFCGASPRSIVPALIEPGPQLHTREIGGCTASVPPANNSTPAPIALTVPAFHSCALGVSVPPEPIETPLPEAVTGVPKSADGGAGNGYTASVASIGNWISAFSAILPDAISASAQRYRASQGRHPAAMRSPSRRDREVGDRDLARPGGPDRHVAVTSGSVLPWVSSVAT